MLHRIMMFGAIAGAIAGAMLGVMALGFTDVPQAIGMAIGYTTMLIALSLIFVAVKRQRDEEGGGVIRFWPAFGMGLAITCVAGLIYAVAWEAAMALSGGDFMADYAAKDLAAKRAAGVSAADLARAKAEWDQFAAQYANPLFRMPLTFLEIAPVGVLVSLVSAALLRNSRFMPARPAMSGAGQTG